MLCERQEFWQLTFELVRSYWVFPKITISKGAIAITGIFGTIWNHNVYDQTQNQNPRWFRFMKGWLMISVSIKWTTEITMNDPNTVWRSLVHYFSQITRKRANQKLESPNEPICKFRSECICLEGKGTIISHITDMDTLVKMVQEPISIVNIAPLLMFTSHHLIPVINRISVGLNSSVGDHFQVTLRKLIIQLLYINRRTRNSLDQNYVHLPLLHHRFLHNETLSLA